MAVILDACSRWCIGWALDRNLDATLVLNALSKRLHSALDYKPPTEFEKMMTRVKTVA